MKKGICIYFNGMLKDECFNCVSFKSVVTIEAGKKCFPCVKKQGGTVFCALYQEPTKKMIDEWNRVVKGK